MYSAGAGGAQASTIYPCGHMAYYDSGGPPPVICPMCGSRHQNAHLMSYSGSNLLASTYSGSNLSSPNTAEGFVFADGALAPELKNPSLAWLDRELDRYLRR